MIEEDSMESLLESLADEDMHVRIFTIDAIVDNQNRIAAIPELNRLLLEDKKEVRIKVAWALGKIADPRSVEVLVKSLNDTEWEVRRNAVRALGELMALEEMSSLVKMLEDIHWEVRAEAVVVLEYLGWVPATKKERVLILIAKEKWEDIFELDELDEDLLIVFLQDSECEIKSKISWILGELQSSSAVEPLYQLLLKDKYQEVKENAAIALGKIGGQSVLNLLQDALKSEDWFIRKCATSALGYTKDSIALELLQQLVKDGNRFVSESAQEALDRIQSKG